MAEFGKILDSSSVRFVRTLSAPIEQVWDHLVRSEYLRTWLGDGDLGPGLGPYSLKVEGPDLPHSTGATIVGEVVRWQPPASLAFTWNHLAPGTAEPTIAESLVEIELRQLDDGTELTLVHGRIAAEFTVRLSTGWHAFLDALACRLTGDPIDLAGHSFPTLFPAYDAQMTVLRDLK